MQVLPTFNKITISVLFLGSLFLLISALKPGRGLKNRAQRLTAVTALLGLLYVGLELYWYFNMGFLRSRGLATAYYLAWRLVGGVSVAMLLHIVSPKSTRVVLVISGLSFVAFNLFAIILYGPRHLASAIRILSLGNGLLIGLSITSVVFLWLGFTEGKASNQNGNGDAAMPGTTAGSGTDA